MAKGMDKVLEKGLEQLEKEVTCAICQDHYTEPKLLPCGHYYCKQCILRVALRTGANQPFNCPECRKEATLPQSSVDNLQTAFFINRFKEAYATLQQGAEETTAKHTPEGNKCSVHDKSMKLYCFDCSHLICSRCAIKEHTGHNVDYSEEAAPKTKKELQETLAPLKEERASLSLVMEEIQTTEEDLDSQGNSVARKVTAHFEELHAILERQKQELLEEARLEVKRKRYNLSQQAEELSIAIAELQSIIDHTEQCVSHCTDNEIMRMHVEICRTIEGEIEKHNKRKGLRPMEEADLGVEVSCTEALQQLCQTKNKITRLPIDPSKCTVLLEGGTAAEVSKTSAVIVTTKLSDNHQTRRRATVSCSFKSVVDNSAIQCKVEGLGDSRYHIEYTPTVRGRHQLTVSVNRQEVAGSPFPVFVSPSPTLLGMPVRVWKNVISPRDITINSEGEVMVIEGDDVTIFNQSKKRLRSIKQSEHELQRLYSVAVDSEDNIYIPDEYTSRIYKWNKKDSKGEIRKVKQIRGSGFDGIAVVGKEVMACVNEARGSITVYNRELEHVRDIVHQDMGKLYRISPDNSCGNLYCIDRDNCCIQVLSNGGEFLRSIGRDRNGVNKLHSPLGVCVAGQYVYVTDAYYHNVSVFTTECEYVTSFGQNGSKYGCFNSPGCICVDKYGFVYVCDYENNRVQVF